MELVQHPKGDNKFLTVAELLELADACRKYDIDTKRLLCADGIIGIRNELRGLKVKENQKQ
jgi:hypothetical protein